MLPTLGCNDHCTCVPGLGLTADCRLWEASRLTCAGKIFTGGEEVGEGAGEGFGAGFVAASRGGVNEIVAVVDRFVPSLPAAVRVTVCACAISAGAVYRPESDTVPTLGFKVHVIGP